MLELELLWLLRQKSPRQLIQLHNLCVHPVHLTFSESSSKILPVDIITDVLVASHNYLLYKLSDPDSTLVTHFTRCHPSSCPPSHSTTFFCKQCPITWQDCLLLLCIQQRPTPLTFTEDKMWPRLRLFLHWWWLLQDKRYATDHIPPSLRHQTTDSTRSQYAYSIIS